MPVSEVLESYLSLRRAIALLRATATKNQDFGHSQISILYRLLQSNANMGELAEYAISDKAATTRTVASLEKAGFVRRIHDKDDRRVINIELTEKGKTKARIAEKIRSSVGKKLDGSLNLIERKQLTFLIHKITKNIDSIKD